MAKPETAKKKKAPNAALVAATAALKNAKSDQEKLVARSNLKLLKFKLLAPARINKLLAAMNNLQRLGNRASYLYDASQVDKMSKAVSAKYDELQKAFSVQADGKKSAGFTFEE